VLRMHMHVRCIRSRQRLMKKVYSTNATQMCNVVVNLQVGMGVIERNENYNTPVLAELSERGK